MAGCSVSGGSTGEPAGLGSLQRTPSPEFPAPSLLFCAGMTFLPGGQAVWSPAGTSPDGLGLPNSNVFNFSTNSLDPGPDMAQGRWYPTATMLASGEILVMAGTDQNGNTVMVPEVRMDQRHLAAVDQRVPVVALLPRATSWHPTAASSMPASCSRPTISTRPGTGSWTFVAEPGQWPTALRRGRDVPSGQDSLRRWRRPPTRTAEVINLNLASPAVAGDQPQWPTARRQLNLTHAARWPGTRHGWDQRPRLQQSGRWGACSRGVGSGEWDLDHLGRATRLPGSTIRRRSCCPDGRSGLHRQRGRGRSAR